MLFSTTSFLEGSDGPSGSIHSHNTTTTRWSMHTRMTPMCRGSALGSQPTTRVLVPVSCPTAPKTTSTTDAGRGHIKFKSEDLTFHKLCASHPPQLYKSAKYVPLKPCPLSSTNSTPRDADPPPPRMAPCEYPCSRLVVVSATTRCYCYRPNEVH